MLKNWGIVGAFHFIYYSFSSFTKCGCIFFCFRSLPSFSDFSLFSWIFCYWLSDILLLFYLFFLRVLLSKLLLVYSFVSILNSWSISRAICILSQCNFPMKPRTHCQKISHFTRRITKIYPIFNRFAIQLNLSRTTKINSANGV